MSGITRAPYYRSSQLLAGIIGALVVLALRLALGQRARFAPAKTLLVSMAIGSAGTSRFPIRFEREF
ncbi:hypothetical protein HGP17_32190 [Rhizobium sp. P38BS-XIX]|uniref:hypothetical protein n=1 Tax=Rhizobium sp. P38BS-XIX TaxID=2726740 RepID=UPI0014568141|nr:hypothetical protein [Rhizobium sp. P38BS-XIX]NLS01518.1 hypothetical protein [Rhizobium sp. P38BS-XIX]